MVSAYEYAVDKWQIYPLRLEFTVHIVALPFANKARWWTIYCLFSFFCLFIAVELCLLNLSRTLQKCQELNRLISLFSRSKLYWFNLNWIFPLKQPRRPYWKAFLENSSAENSQLLWDLQEQGKAHCSTSWPVLCKFTSPTRTHWVDLTWTFPFLQTKPSRRLNTYERCEIGQPKICEKVQLHSARWQPVSEFHGPRDNGISGQLENRQHVDGREEPHCKHSTKNGKSHNAQNTISKRFFQMIATSIEHQITTLMLPSTRQKAYIHC